VGDRTCVTINIRKSDYDRILKEEFDDSYEKLKDKVDADEINGDKDLVSFIGYEVNYADWTELQDFLQGHSIEYDKQWDQGGGYSAGKSHVRNIDGEMKEVEFDAEFFELAAFLRHVKDLPPEEIQKQVQEKYKDLYPFEIKPLIEEPERHGK
jgi:hypothetical protein